MRRILPALALLLLSAGTRQEKRPNILWIIGEDLGPELECYGHPQVRTPNLNRLAAEGVRYARAFTVTPVCSTSRSSFMTGMYAMSIGAHHHRSHRGDGFTLPEGVRLLTHRLKDAGYFTANVVHLTDRPKERFYRGTGKTDWNFSFEGRAYDSNRWADLKGKQPFYAQINFPETHRGGAWDSAHTRIEKTADPAEAVFPPYYPDHPVTRKDWAQYLNTVMALDLKVGFVLKKLEEDGLVDDTVVVFMGDHGRAMVRGKQWPYDSGLHVPLIIRWPKNFPAPGRFEAGSVDGRLIASIDVAATTLAVAGVPKPEGMQGRVFLGAAAEPDREYVFAGRDRGDETMFRVRTVRTKRYRYLRNFMHERPFLQINRYKEWSYPVLRLMRKLHAEGKLDPVQDVLFAPSRPREELYDVEKDPYEIRNLAGSPEHREVLEKLRGVLEDWIERIDDKGRIPEDPSIQKTWEERMKKAYDRRIREREAREKGK